MPFIDKKRILRGRGFIEFPFDVEKTSFGTRGRVKVLLLRVGRVPGIFVPGHIIGMPKAIHDQLGKRIGDSVSVRVMEDKEERTAEISPILAAELKKDKEQYSKLSYTRKKEIANLLYFAKKEGTIKTRFDKIMKELQKRKK